MTKSYNCDCGEDICFFKSETDFNILQMRLEEFVDEIDENDFKMLSIPIIKFPKYNTYNKLKNLNKCKIYTDYIKLHKYNEQITKITDKVLNEFVEKNKCEKELFYCRILNKKLIKMNKEMIDDIDKMREKYNDVNKKISKFEKTLKSRYKYTEKLEFVVEKLKMYIDQNDILDKIDYLDDADATLSEEEFNSDSSDDYYIEEDNLEMNKEMLLYNYERINRYVNSKTNNGLKNYVEKFNIKIKNKILNRYFKLKFKRNILAHPFIEFDDEIKDDDELFSLLKIKN